MSEEIVLNKRIEEFENKLKVLLQEYKLKLAFTMDFPIYKQLPDEVLLALKVLDRHQYNIKLNYLDGENKQE